MHAIYSYKIPHVKDWNTLWQMLTKIYYHRNHREISKKFVDASTRILSCRCFVIFVCDMHECFCVCHSVCMCASWMLNAFSYSSRSWTLIIEWSTYVSPIIREILLSRSLTLITHHQKPLHFKEKNSCTFNRLNRRDSIPASFIFFTSFRLELGKETAQTFIWTFAFRDIDSEMQTTQPVESTCDLLITSQHMLSAVPV